MFWKVKMSFAFKRPLYTNNIYWFKIGWWRRWVYWKRAQSAMTRKRLRAKYVQWVGPVLQFFFPQKPTPDKYSASDRLKGESPPPVPAATRTFANICRFPLMRPKIPPRVSHGKGWMKQRSSQIRFHSGKKPEGRQYFNVTQRALSSQSSVYEVSGTLERLEHQATLKRRALKQHVKHIAGKGILINWFASIFIQFLRVCFLTASSHIEKHGLLLKYLSCCSKIHLMDFRSNRICDVLRVYRCVPIIINTEAKF